EHAVGDNVALDFGSARKNRLGMRLQIDIPEQLRRGLSSGDTNHAEGIHREIAEPAMRLTPHDLLQARFRTNLCAIGDAAHGPQIMIAYDLEFDIRFREASPQP